MYMEAVNLKQLQVSGDVHDDQFQQFDQLLGNSNPGHHRERNPGADMGTWKLHEQEQPAAHAEPCCAQPDKHFHPLTKGMRISKYEVKRKLAQGGFATVFRAWDEEHQVSVAIKVDTEPMKVSPQVFSGEGGIEALRKELNGYLQYQVHKDEFSGYRQLQFGWELPGIPKIYETGLLKLKDNEVHTYVVMELLGQSILSACKCRCKKRRMDGHDCTQYNRSFFFEVAHAMLSAVETFHKQGMVHRDIKPGNFCFCPDEEGYTGPLVYLVDMGFVKTKPATMKEAEEEDVFVGTPDYASSQGLKGRRQSQADDLESLGYSLLEMYLGELPWDVTAAEHHKSGRSTHIRPSQWTKEALKAMAATRERKWADLTCSGHNSRGQHRNSIVPDFLVQWIKYVKGLNPLEDAGHSYLRSLLQGAEHDLAVEEGRAQPQLVLQGVQDKQQQQQDVTGKPDASCVGESQPQQSFCGVASNTERIESSGGSWQGEEGDSLEHSCASGSAGDAALSNALAASSCGSENDRQDQCSGGIRSKRRRIEYSVAALPL